MNWGRIKPEGSREAEEVAGVDGCWVLGTLGAGSACGRAGVQSEQCVS